ncbi:hypothetical protein EOM86_08330 [Candidatus Nomurabacteria bacterium]|nr:hypothetical protein [Candidatus Nomurabacteria bacterium]
MIKTDKELDKKILHIFKKVMKAASRKISLVQIEEWMHQTPIDDNIPKDGDKSSEAVSAEPFYQLLDVVDSLRELDDYLREMDDSFRIVVLEQVKEESKFGYELLVSLLGALSVFERMTEELKEALATVGALCLKIPTQTPLYFYPQSDYLPITDGDAEKNKYYLLLSPNKAAALERVHKVYTLSDKISKKLVAINRKMNHPYIICKHCGKKVKAHRSTKIYCSARCRQASKREREMENEN